MDSYILKPNRAAFRTFPFYRSTIIKLIVFIIISTIVILTTNTYRVIILIAIWAVFFISVLINHISLKKRFEKTSWTITPNKIFWRTGGIFSDSEVEVPIKNITHVSLTKPWLEFKWFKTGKIKIDSAGTSRSSVRMFHIEKPALMYEYVQKNMIANGFSLQKKKLVQSTTPNILITFAKTAGAIVIFIVFFGLQLLGAFIAIIISAPQFAINLIFLLGIVVALPVVLIAIFQYKNLKATQYRVYDDCIEYNNGFLTTHDVIIPAENITDTQITQKLFDRMFDVHNLKISCQGSSKEISFPNILHGDAMKSSIEALNANFDPIRNKGTHFGDGISANIKTSKILNRKVSRDTLTTLTFKMQKKSVVLQILIPILIIILVLFVAGISSFLILGIENTQNLLLGAALFTAASAMPVIIIIGIAIISPIIRAAITTYKLGKTTISSKTEFISKSSQEFSTDRITSVVAKTSLIQKFIGTCSIFVFSIGSAQPIVFQHVQKSILETLLTKVGITSNLETITTETPAWSIGIFVVRLLPLLGGLLIIGIILLVITNLGTDITGLTTIINYVILGVIVIFVLIIIVALIHSMLYVKYTSLAQTKEFLFFKTGWLKKTKKYVLAQNVRDVFSRKIPFSKRGMLKIEVAGEAQPVQDAQNKKKQQVLVSNNIQLQYVKNRGQLHEQIDLFLANTNKTPEVYQTVQPTVKAALIKRTIFHLILFPLLVIYPFTCIHLLLSRRAMKYSFDSIRVQVTGGILFKYKKTIISNKIDHVAKHQGPLQKLTKVGSISIATTGTSSFEISIKDILPFEEWYTDLKKLSDK